LAADSKRHKESFVFILIFFVSISLVSVMTIWRNSRQYVKDEMDWLGYFQSEQKLSDFYSRFLGVPLTGATLLAISFFLLDIHGK